MSLPCFIGKNRDNNPEKGLSHNVVTTLVAGLEGKGYHIYMDNFYSSPELFSDLQHNGFEACGTVRINRVGIPKSFQNYSVSKGLSIITIIHCYYYYY